MCEHVGWKKVYYRLDKRRGKLYPNTRCQECMRLRSKAWRDKHRKPKKLSKLCPMKHNAWKVIQKKRKGGTYTTRICKQCQVVWSQEIRKFKKNAARM